MRATQGPDGLLVSELKNFDFVALDPGFMTTAQCESKITYIDGERSILRYRGYPIENLAETSNFVETAYLLIFGELPTEKEYSSWRDDINHSTLISEDYRGFLASFPRKTHPMTVLASAIGAIPDFIGKSFDPLNDDDTIAAAKMIMAKTRTITSFVHKRLQNNYLIYPDYSRGYVDDFLRMCFTTPYKQYESNPLFVRTLDKLLMLHADHEQNCSTTVVRIAGSSNSSLFASVSAGVSALSGPLHGGANEAALKQLRDIFEFAHAGKSVKDYVDQAKADGRKLAGLGHRVYKSYDPRAAIAKNYARQIFEAGEGNLELFDIALELEEIALKDEYFVERGLYPNVDFWTGLIYHAMGFDDVMFTALFALGRIPGWIAQWREMHFDPQSKIGRPRQVYSGEVLREHPCQNRWVEADEAR